MKRTTIAIVVSLIIGAFLWSLESLAEPPQPKQDLKPVMVRKLGHAKALLEGLAKEDHAVISREAQALSLLSLESGWEVMVTKEYLKQSDGFRRALETIRNGAKAENLDRATIGYVDMTLRCVECHKYVRQQNAPAANQQ